MANAMRNRAIGTLIILSVASMPNSCATNPAPPRATVAMVIGSVQMYVQPANQPKRLPSRYLDH
ncbi:hypothetical protein D3C73_1267320 [compost metagenome]